MLLGVKAMQNSMTYLGLPTIVGRSTTFVFQFVKERGWKKLKGWKEKFLSQAGRETLIKAVVQAILSYFMSCFKLLASVCNQIEAMIAKVLWRGNVDEKKIHWIR